MAGFGNSSFDRAEPLGAREDPAPPPRVYPIIGGKYAQLGSMESAWMLALRAGGYHVKAEAPILRVAGASTAYVLVDGTDGRHPIHFAVPVGVALSAGLISQAAWAEVEGRNTAEQRAKEVAEVRAGIQKAGEDGHPDLSIARELGESAGKVAGQIGSAAGSALGLVGSVFGEGVKGALLGAGFHT